MEINRVFLVTAVDISQKEIMRLKIQCSSWDSAVETMKTWLQQAKQDWSEITAVPCLEKPKRTDHVD